MYCLHLQILGHRKKIAAMLAGADDVRGEFAWATPDQARHLFLQHFPGEIDLANQFSNMIPTNSVSYCEVEKKGRTSKDLYKNNSQVKFSLKLVKAKSFSQT